MLNIRKARLNSTQLLALNVRSKTYLGHVATALILLTCMQVIDRPLFCGIWARLWTGIYLCQDSIATLFALLLSFGLKKNRVHGNGVRFFKLSHGLPIAAEEHDVSWPAGVVSGRFHELNHQQKRHKSKHYDIIVEASASQKNRGLQHA